MSKPELGTKRVCPETGRKFYDLNRDPIVSPYTGQTYPLTFFEGGEPEPEVKKAPEPKPQAAEAEPEKETADVEIVSLEDADKEAADTGETIPDGDDDDDVDLGDDDDDTFLETDDDDDDDVSDIIAVNEDKEET